MIRVLEDLTGLSPSIGNEGVELLRRVFGTVYADMQEQARISGVDEMLRVEVAIDRLTEAQARNEAAIDRLVEAQGRTEAAVPRLAKSVEDLSTEVGGIARNTAFFREDRAYLALPALLAERLGITVTGRLTRTFLEVSGRRVEVDVWGQGRRADGNPVRVIGESRLQLRRRHLRDFERRLTLIEPLLRGEEAVPILVAAQAEPEVVKLAEARGWLVVFSYDVEEANARGRSAGAATAG